MKLIVFTLLLLSLAAPAAARCVWPNRCIDEIALIFFGTQQIDLDGECLHRGTPLVQSSVCTGGLTKWFPAANVVITNISASIYTAGDAGYQCDLDLMLGGIASGLDTKLSFATDAVQGAAISQDQPNIRVAVGTSIGIRGDSEGTCDITINPAFDVWVNGHYE